MIRKILIITVLIGLMACGEAPPVPTDHFYRLTLPQQGMEKQQLPVDVIYVGDFRAEGLYNERALLYTNDSDSRELRQHHYHFWITSPSHLLRDHMIDYLRRSSTAMVIGEPGSDDGIKLTGKILEFVYQSGNNPGTADVSMELRLHRPDNDKPVLLKVYSISEPVNGTNMNEIVAAFNRATLTIYGQFLQDFRDL